MDTRSALVVGATGLVGGHLLQLLLGDDAYGSVTVLARKPLAIQHPKLRACIINFDQLDLSRDAIRGDDVFCCLGTTISIAGSQEAFRRVDFVYVVQTAALAFENGAKQCLTVSALGANVNSRIFYNRVKGEVEQAVAKLPFDAVHIFRPSFLLGERKESRPGEKIGIALMKSLSFMLVSSIRKYRAIHAQAVAKAMVAVAKQRRTGVNIYESDHIQQLSQS